MPEYSHLDPAGFSLSGGKVGVLLLHGFSGSPTEMRPIAEALAPAYTIEAPLIAGHGADRRALARSTRQAWKESAVAAYDRLAEKHEQVFIVGQSMGAMLAIMVAQVRPGVAGLITLAPALYASPLLALTPALKHLIPFVPKLEETFPDLVDRAALHQVWSNRVMPLPALEQVWRLQKEARGAAPSVTRPILILIGARDRTMHEPQTLGALIGSTDKTIKSYARSAHILSVDSDREEVTADIAGWPSALARNDPGLLSRNGPPMALVH